MNRTGRWGRAGQRLSEQEVAERSRAAARRSNEDKLRRAADDAVAYRLWRAGEVKPYLLTWALDACGLYGPEVDTACGATEPDVDLWEAGKLYPTWEQLCLLAELTGRTPRLLCSTHMPLSFTETSLRFHHPSWERDHPPPVWSYPADVVAATVGGTSAALSGEE